MSQDHLTRAELDEIFRDLSDLGMGSDLLDNLRLLLQNGQLDQLLDLGEKLNASSLSTLAVNPRIRMDGLPVLKVTSGITSVPGVKADATVFAPVVKTIRATAPELADGIDDKVDPKDITAYLALLTALLQLITAIVAIYQVAHQQPPTPAQITQIFDSSIHQTIVVNPPPPQPKPGAAEGETSSGKSTGR